MRLKSTRIISAGLGSVVALLLTAAVLTPGADAATGRSLRIVGGSTAAPGQFPWMVALVDPGAPNAADGQFCAGSLIAPRVVITAGHCVYGTTASEIDAVVGRTRLSHGNDGQRIRVTRIVRHPDYDPRTLANDVALLQLAEPATVVPLALDGPGDVAQEQPATPVLVSGWGATSEGGPGSDDLRFVGLQVRPTSVCQATFDAVSASKTVCAGSSRQGEDACQGDSGGPLTRGSGASSRLVGVVSYGAGCGRQGVPAVYTRVATLRAFVTEQTAFLNATCPPPGRPSTRRSCGSPTCPVGSRRARRPSASATGPRPAASC